MTPSAQLANYVAQKFVKADAPDLVALCGELGLRIREVPAKRFDGAPIRSKEGQKGIVAVKASMREASRKRFAIAHEIGHFIIPHHRNLGHICEERKIESFDKNLNRPEIEANEFAAELLLPSAVLRKRFNLADFSLGQISAAATDFGTSLTATTRSFLTLTLASLFVITLTSGLPSDSLTSTRNRLPSGWGLYANWLFCGSITRLRRFAIFVGALNCRVLPTIGSILVSID